MPAELTRDCWYLTGPTASGKTQMGIELARLLDAEIVSLDSMALFRRLDIGTAKPTPAERAAVPHHLVDLVEPDADFSLAEYVSAAEACVRQITARGRQVLFVGGTPLYLKALLRGIFAGPEADWELRRSWETRAAQEEPGWLHAQVAAIDPASAAKLHANDTRRLIRALEVFAKTGVPISAWQQQFDQARPAESCRVFVLDWPREQLYARIDARVDAMFAAGLIAEVEQLLASGVSLSRTARQAVGYREVLEYLAGERDLAATIERVKLQTHQFARRQLTWYRSLSECRWIPMQPGVDTRTLAESLVATADRSAS
ncbi:MAG: tRNA (adenosine(37)-N6)-dimethylallyltransferase MiaA [Planctomycetaceae bacterium]|nr:tRNA (adenosine(37)-N6)-dimethylallyltransferase MiaA [Planctomycetaceae bacterium]